MKADDSPKKTLDIKVADVLAALKRAVSHVLEDCRRRGVKPVVSKKETE